MNRTPDAAPHAPARGRLAKILGTFHVTGSFWFRFHHFGARALPEGPKRVVVFFCTVFFCLALIRIRRAVASNLVAVLGTSGPWARWRRIWRTLHTHAWSLTERYESLSIAPEFDVGVENWEAWEMCMGRGGTIVVTGHIGNWEIGSALPATREGRQVHLVREPEQDPQAQEFIRSLLSERMGPQYHTHFAGEDPKLALLLREALERGEVVALQGDRPRAGGKTVAATLFDRPFLIPEGPLVLARTSGAPLLPCFMIRRGRRTYRLRVGEPIPVASTDSRRDDLREAAGGLAAAFEAVIAAEPHQWFCFAELWPTRPGERTY